MAGLIVGILALGCASATEVGIRSLAADGARNEFALAEKCDEQRLRVTGTVSNIGSMKREVLNVTFLPSPLGGTATGTKSYEAIPYVTLRDGTDLLHCFFSAEDRSELAQLTRGQSITFEGTYAAFKREQGVSRITLSHCAIAD